MKNRIFVLLFTSFLLPTNSLQADKVTLTNKEGRSIEVKITTVAAGVATVVREDGRQFRIPETTLDEKSQKVLDDWKLEQIASLRDPLRILINNFTQNRERRNTTSRNIQTYEEGYRVRIQNMSPMILPEMKVEYLILKSNQEFTDFSSRDAQLVKQKGEAKLESLGMRQQATIETVTVPMEQNRLKSGWSHSGGGQRDATDRLVGLWLRFKNGDKIIYEYARPSTIPEMVEWEE